MGINSIDSKLFREMFLSGAHNLENKKEWINELNVFPVPDGDTGTNMTLTIKSAAAEVEKLEGHSLDEMAKAISSGSLRGARGNSGVILSQLFRGFTKAIRDYNEIDADIITKAMKRSVDTAYKAVMKPKEGTILTVAKGMYEKAEEIVPEEKDLTAFLDLILEAGNETLARTPDLLPVLKEAGVVDSGGQGLMAVIEGCVLAFKGQFVELEEVPEAVEVAEREEARKEISTDDIKFGYCTEFIINLEKPFPETEEKKMKEFLTSIGDSLVLVAMDDLVKIHVHTNHPGLAFEKALEYGSLTRMKIDNMREEHQERLFKDSEKLAAKQKAEMEALKEVPKERKPVGFISVTIGDGMSEIFKGLGVDYLIEGGQTMNPSTDDMLKAIEAVNADTVYILPNNKNVILAANQAQAIVDNCNVIVIPTKTVPQGITAIVSYVPDRTPEENAAAMTEEITGVKTGEVTYAVRDTKVDGKEIHSGDIMGIGDAGILAVGTDIETVSLDMLRAIVDEDSEVISIYNGSDYDSDKTEALAAKVAREFPDVDVEVNYGGQPIYYVILSVE